MPYIQKEQWDFLRPTSAVNARTPGELNFQITCLLIDYCKAQSFNYQIVNDVMGALEGAKAEFYRRKAAPYEDSKIALNGDVYGD